MVIGKDLARLDALYERGARYLGLTHTGHNDICTSSGLLKELGDKPDYSGLSAFGESVVRRANKLGMMVDVSHLSDLATRLEPADGVAERRWRSAELRGGAGKAAHAGDGEESVEIDQGFAPHI